MVDPVRDCRSSRKCFTVIQTARHSARTSHTVMSIQLLAIARGSAPVIEQWYVLKRMISCHEIWLLCFATITPLATVMAKNIIRRNISIALDRWYMACNRIIMITPSMAFMMRNARHCTKPRTVHLFRSLYWTKNSIWSAISLTLYLSTILMGDSTLRQCPSISNQCSVYRGIEEWRRSIVASRSVQTLVWTSTPNRISPQQRMQLHKN